MTRSDSIHLTSAFSRDTATIKTGGHTIVVGPSVLLLDGAKIGTIEESTKSVEVTMEDGTITFIADGKPVPTAMR